jgi:hypothetical protein
MEDVHELLKQGRYASAMLVPADDGLREMYRKMGYDDCTTIGSLSCAAGETAAEVRNVEIEEYAGLRRERLPENAVLQEGLQLPFLAAQAQLFAGTDFLLAAFLDNDRLHGMELLGDLTVAPGILRALGCETGSFQIPGGCSGCNAAQIQGGIVFQHGKQFLSGRGLGNFQKSGHIRHWLHDTTSQGKKFYETGYAFIAANVQRVFREAMIFLPA